MPEPHHYPGEKEVIREGDEIIIRFNYEHFTSIPSLEDSEIVMGKTMDALIEVGRATKLIFSQKRDYEYDYSQTMLLVEIANLIVRIKREKLEYTKFAAESAKRFGDLKYTEIQDIMFRLMRTDPLGAFVELNRLHRRERIILEDMPRGPKRTQIEDYVVLIEHLISELKKTKLIQLTFNQLPGYRLGDRSLYRKIFTPSIKPDFMYTKLMSSYPPDARELDSYQVGMTEITIFELPDSIKTLYHAMPPEFKLDEEKYQLLDEGRRIMAEHKPKRSEFIDPMRMRQVFGKVGMDLIEELAGYHKISLKSDELEELSKILLRYTVGFGPIEVLLGDPKVQDINVNSPFGQLPIYIVHSDFEDCFTNIIPTIGEAESWASKLRMISGRPLDEANPILDTELELPGASTRISVITSPLDPTGFAYSFRRHRDKPWTLPLFLVNGMMSEIGAGLLSFLIDGTRTFFVCGTRGSGKTSFLSSLMIEIMRRNRIITIEDTLELPFNPMRKLGFNIVQMKVASALASGKGGSEFTATQGIRSTLRLGDSSLFVGEVRSEEAVALFEAMRVGAGANVVGGTFHADSPFGVYDRCVNAIGIPKTSFKALDINIIANPIRSADGIHKKRRITQITEIKKMWQDDPLLENGFVDLMKYNSHTDLLEPTDDLINGETDVLKSIAGNVKEWARDWDAVWNNILLRGKIKMAQKNLCLQVGRKDLLEAEFTIRCNDEFHKTSERVQREVGSLDLKRIEYEWMEWLRTEMKRRLIADSKRNQL